MKHITFHLRTQALQGRELRFHKYLSKVSYSIWFIKVSFTIPGEYNNNTNVPNRLKRLAINALITGLQQRGVMDTMCLLRLHQKVWNNDRVVWTEGPSYRARQNWASRDLVSLSDCHWRKCMRCEEGAEPLMCSRPEEGGTNQHCEQSDHCLRGEREGRGRKREVALN